MATWEIGAAQELSLFALFHNEVTRFAFGTRFHVIRLGISHFFLRLGFLAISATGITAIGEIGAADEFFPFFVFLNHKRGSTFWANFSCWLIVGFVLLDVMAGRKIGAADEFLSLAIAFHDQRMTAFRT